jgi:hypothetical protein
VDPPVVTEPPMGRSQGNIHVDASIAFIEGLFRLERDAFWLNRRRAPSFCLSMILSENRYSLFRGMF